MEEELLAGVIQSDTHRRLQVAEQLLEYFKKENGFNEFPEFERLIGGLSAWMGSSNFKVSVSGMQIVEAIVLAMKDKFRPYVSTIFPSLKERLGDAKDQVREQAQHLIQKIMVDCVSSPQLFLDKLLESCLVHKNWRVKEQGLLCLSRTLSFFGSGLISVSKYMGPVCTLLGDANSQVRSGAMETIVEVYRHVGVKIRIDLSKRGLPSSRMSQLTARFNAVDATTGNHSHYSDEDDRESISSSGSNASARTHGSSRSTGSRNPPRPSSVARLAPTGSGAVTESDFEKAFSVSPRFNLYTQHDVEKVLASINSTLTDTTKSWDLRVAALRDLRSVTDQEILDHTHFTMLLKNLESALTESLKDLRSQITKEACISISYLCVVLGTEVVPFATAMLPQLLALLPNSAKVMSTSAEICIKFIIQHAPSQKFFAHLSSSGFSSKSAITRRYASELLLLCVSSFDNSLMTRVLPQIEELLKLAIKDNDAMARKNGRKVFWGYHGKFPSQGRRLLDSFDTTTQKHLNDEKLSSSTSSHTGVLQQKKASTVPSFSESDLSGSRDQQHSPSSPTHAPSIRLTRPTVRGRRGNSAKGLRSASSMDNMLDESEKASPIPRPASRTGGASSVPRPASRTGGSSTVGGTARGIPRPSSRTGVRPQSRTGISSKSSTVGRAGQGSRGGQRYSRSAQPSPSHSRETSPVGRVGGAGRNSMQRKIAPLTADSLLKLYGNGAGRDDEDDDVASVNSDRSALSFSSEISINPYTRFTQPIQDLNELVAMCSTSQWSERRDGIAQLHMLLESSRTFGHSEMEKVKAVFKRMFHEPHAKVYSMFLDTLSRFIQEHREYMDDWLFMLLLKLLQRSGTDMLSSVLFKLQMVLEHIRKAFDPEAQFAALCRIVTDPTQTLNNKVKLAFLEYLLELIPLLDPSDFKDSQEIRQAVAKVVKFTGEPKSAEIRKLSQKSIVALFDLSPATFSLILRTLPKGDQDSANRILNAYISELPSSGDESDREISSTPRTKKATPTTKATPKKTPVSRRVDPAASLPPSGPRGLKGIKAVSSPNMYQDPAQSLPPSSGSRGRIRTPGRATPSGGRTTPSLIPTPRGGLRRPMSTTPGASPSTNTNTNRKRYAPPRSASVGPEKLAQQLANNNSFKSSPNRIPRPESARSNYSPSLYNGSDGSSPTNSAGVPQFSFSDLASLDFGSPDEDEGEREDEEEKDHMTLVVRELQSASTSKQRHNALQSLYTLSREFPERCKWEDHFKGVLLKLVEIISDQDSAVRVLVLRIIREMLKTEQSRLKNYAELTTIKILKAFSDEDSVVSQAAEDVFPLLAPALPTESAIELLSPMASSEKYPLLLGIIKLLTKVLNEVSEDYLSSSLSLILPGVTRGYRHSESSVRKASVFCLVAIHGVVGEQIREHLTKLSSSQTKLLDLYIKRSQQEASKATAAKK